MVKYKGVIPLRSQFLHNIFKVMTGVAPFSIQIDYRDDLHEDEPVLAHKVCDKEDREQ